MRGRVLTALSLLVVVTAFTGCAAQSAVESGPMSSTPTPTPTGAKSIQEVWAKIGCKEDDALGTRAILDRQPPTAPLVHTGTCLPLPTSELAFFYQLPSADDAEEWMRAGKLEVGAGDTAFIDGSVILLSRDAATTKLFSQEFEPAPKG